jgi:hypothetical protein
MSSLTTGIELTISRLNSAANTTSTVTQAFLQTLMTTANFSATYNVGVTPVAVTIPTTASSIVVVNNDSKYTTSLNCAQWAVDQFDIQAPAVGTTVSVPQNTNVTIYAGTTLVLGAFNLLLVNDTVGTAANVGPAPALLQGIVLSSTQISLTTDPSEGSNNSQVTLPGTTLVTNGGSPLELSSFEEGDTVQINDGVTIGYNEPVAVTVQNTIVVPPLGICVLPNAGQALGGALTLSSPNPTDNYVQWTDPLSGAVLTPNTAGTFSSITIIFI